MRTELCQIAEEERCDKCPKYGHDYTPFYSKLIPRHSTNFLLEIGVGNRETMAHVPGYWPGASLRMWRRWCPKAYIFGIDINEEAREAEATKICIEIMDATKSDWAHEGVDFDFIIDDGSHVLEDQIMAFEMWQHRCRGWYFIEDVVNKKPLLSYLHYNGHVTRLFEAPSRTGHDDNRIIAINLTEPK